jgi:hypothetical protein
MFPFSKVVTASRGRSFPWNPYQPGLFVKPEAVHAVCSQGKPFRKPADDASPEWGSFSKADTWNFTFVQYKMASPNVQRGCG